MHPDDPRSRRVAGEGFGVLPEVTLSQAGVR